MFVYVFMATAAAIGLVWRIKVAHAFARSAAIIGASFTALALITGSIWGKPMWGTWWIWDARLTSELILLFLYCGFIALGNAIPDVEKSARASAILGILGVVNIPIIHFSVNWWYTLHQGATLSRFAKPAMDASMLWPLLSMILGFFAFFFAILCVRVRSEILWRERHAGWVRDKVRSTI
jgi:heme exporter protein C